MTTFLLTFLSRFSPEKGNVCIDSLPSLNLALRQRSDSHWAMCNRACLLPYLRHPTVLHTLFLSFYACRELVIAYASWISAAFQLKVIRVFLHAKMSTAQQAMQSLCSNRFLLSFDEKGRTHISPAPSQAKGRIGSRLMHELRREKPRLDKERATLMELAQLSSFTESAHHAHHHSERTSAFFKVRSSNAKSLFIDLASYLAVRMHHGPFRQVCGQGTPRAGRAQNVQYSTAQNTSYKSTLRGAVLRCVASKNPLMVANCLRLMLLG